MISKKAIFFTIDALLAAGIMLVAILLLSNYYIVESQKTNINFASQDMVKILSTMTVGQVDNDYVRQLISSGDITNANSTILEQIGQFWSEGKNDLALNLSKNLTSGILPAGYGFSVLVNNEEIFSRNISSKSTLVSSRSLISGIAKAKPTEGYTTRVLLNGIKSKKTSSYSYFGGYEGDGNLTKKLILPNDIISFNSSYIEADTGGSFSLYINGIYSGSYVQGAGGGIGNLADKWNISDAYLANFRGGENAIGLNFTSGSSYIAGGFLRVTYTTSSYNDTNKPGYQKYLFPGIDGTINLYSSIYIPNTLSSMKIFLNYSSNYMAYLNIGNTTVYQGTTNGTTKNFTISNSTLAGLLDYSSIVQKTLPLRLGLTDISFLKKGDADVVLITDVSGSMNWRLDSTSTGTDRNCNDPLLFDPSTKRISLAKCLDNQFVDIILNSSQGNTTNRVGLVSYSGLPNTIPTATSTIIVSIKNLTNSNVTLKNEINAYTPNGATGICGSIRQARIMLQNLSNSSRQKFIVVMTDGIANVQCSLTNEYSTSGCIAKTCNDNSFCAGGGCLKQQCGDWISDRAVNDSIADACRAYNTTNATVYSIGFGTVSTCPAANQTLISIANCGKGSYYSSGNASQLSNIYSTIAQQILNVTFSDQTINTSFSLGTKLFPNSFIEFNYTEPDTQFNRLPLAFETDRFGNNISTGYLYVYPNTSVQDAKVTSYSGSRWTDNLVVNGNNVYSLSNYGSAYRDLGDPFTVNIPVNNINSGNNTITISTGLNSTYSTNGSSDDKVLYTLLISGLGDYSSVLSKANGCSWNVNFEDGTSSVILVPSAYSGINICSYANGIFDADDALDNAAYSLFKNLDIDKNGKLDVNIAANNLDFSTLTVSKVPSLWGPAIIEIRVWQ